MRIQTQIAISITLAATCFAGGYWARDLRGPTHVQIEDQALMSILENVGYAAYLAKSDFAQMRSFIDINLNNHLSTVVAFQGDIQNSDKGDAFEASKIRTLNAVARLWDEQPPFVGSADPTADVMNAPWAPSSVAREDRSKHAASGLGEIAVRQPTRA